MKKIVLLLLSILVLSSSLVVAESEIVILNYKFVPGQSIFLTEIQNVGVTEEPEIITRGLSEPTETKNLSGAACYEFSGQASSSTLYTNYLFTGNTSYDLVINNLHSTADLKVSIYKENAWFATKTVTVPNGGKTEFTVSGFNATDKIYLKFAAPSNFYGTID